MTLCSTLDSALSLGQKPLLIQEEEELPTFNHSQMLNHVSFYNSMNETWLQGYAGCGSQIASYGPQAAGKVQAAG